MDWQLSAAEQAELQAIVEEFRLSVVEHTRSLDAHLLRLERDPGDADLIRDMFLVAHSIKGGAGMLEFSSIVELAHALEDVLAYLRDEAPRPDRATIDLLFRAPDSLRDLAAGSVPGSSIVDPATAELIHALRAAASSTSSMPESGPPAGVPCVLLVEDSPTVRMLETMLLTDGGLEVDAVGDGAAALDMAHRRHYDLIVTGHETRDLRGFDLAAALRTAPAYRWTPILLMTSDDSEVHQRRAAEVGVQVCIRKGPAGRQPLLEIARALLAHRGARSRS